MEKRPKFKRKAMHSSSILNTRKTVQASNFSVIALSVAQKGSAVAGPGSSTRRGTSSTARRRSRRSRRSSRRCVSDQHSRAERGRRNGARPRAGTQLRGGRKRGTQPRATLVERRQEIKDPIATSVDRIRDGSALAGEAGRTMNELMHAVARATDLIAERWDRF